MSTSEAVCVYEEWMEEAEEREFLYKIIKNEFPLASFLTWYFQYRSVDWIQSQDAQRLILRPLFELLVIQTIHIFLLIFLHEIFTLTNFFLSFFSYWITFFTIYFFRLAIWLDFLHVSHTYCHIFLWFLVKLHVRHWIKPFLDFLRIEKLLKLIFFPTDNDSSVLRFSTLTLRLMCSAEKMGKSNAIG